MFVITAAQASKDGRDRDTSSSAYSFDNLFGPDSTNELIYNSAVKQLVHKTVEGFHGKLLSRRHVQYLVHIDVKSLKHSIVKYRIQAPFLRMVKLRVVKHLQ